MKRQHYTLHIKSRVTERKSIFRQVKFGMALKQKPDRPSIEDIP